MPSASCCLAIWCNGHHGLNHDVRIDAAFRQSQLPTAKLLEIKLSQAFRTTEIALRKLDWHGGGFRQSGLGRELGPTGLDEYREAKHVYQNTKPGPSGWFAG